MPGAPTDMTIDELARAGGVVVSTVRLYQSRGLLPPPSRRGRVGYLIRTETERLGLDILRPDEHGATS